MKGEKLGRYTLVRRVGAGGMAEVWKAKFQGPEGFEKTVAVKKILSHLVPEGSFVEMFVAEAKLIAKLTHPNIVQLIDFARAENEDLNTPDYFIAMEYVAGQHLGAILRRAAERGIKLPLEVALFVTIETAKALGYAHSEGLAATGRPSAVVHQDISPANILVSYGGDVKVTDFGIANVVRALIPQQEGRVTGKVGYMSPEQARARPLDPRSDLFSLGIVLCELCTGRRLFPGKTAPEILQKIVAFTFPEEKLSHLPYDVVEIMRKALHNERGDRYQEATEMEIDLSSILDRGSHIAARNALASMVQSLFDDEYNLEVTEEYGEAAEATSQMANPLAALAGQGVSQTASTTVVVSELGVHEAVEPRRVERSTETRQRDRTTTAGGAGTQASGEVETVSPDAPTKGVDPTRILERRGVFIDPQEGGPHPDDPPTLDGPVGVREDDPTLMGPAPRDVPGPRRGADDLSRSRSRPSANATEVGPPPKPIRPTKPGGPAKLLRPSDRPTAPRDLRGVIDYPDQKESRTAARLLVVGALLVALIVLGMVGRYLYNRSNPINLITPTPPATEIVLTTPPKTPRPTETVTEVSMNDTATPVRTTAATPRPTPTRTRRPVKTPTPRPATPVRTVATPVRTPTPRPAVVRYGFLTVKTKPWAEVWINGGRRGMERLPRTKLKAGVYNLEFRNGKFRDRRQVRVHPNRDTIVVVDVRGRRVNVRYP